MAEPLNRLYSLKLIGDDVVPVGSHVLMRGGEVVWSGPLGSPIEDVDCDSIIFNTADLERLAPRIVRKLEGG